MPRMFLSLPIPLEVVFHQNSEIILNFLSEDRKYMTEIQTNHIVTNSR